MNQSVNLCTSEMHLMIAAEHVAQFGERNVHLSIDRGDNELTTGFSPIGAPVTRLGLGTNGTGRVLLGAPLDGRRNTDIEKLWRVPVQHAPSTA